MAVSNVGELLHWSYANLAMAHSAVSSGSTAYGPRHYMVRSRLYKGLQSGTMTMGPLAEDERLKMILPQACCYCGSLGPLAADHLIPTKRGGANTGDNLVWACRGCNSSKCATDVLEWLGKRGAFPPLLLLRRYLKLATEIAQEREIMQTPIAEAGELPFALTAIPKYYPPPGELRLWIVPLVTE